MVSEKLNIKQLKEVAKQIRENIILMIYKAKAGHPGGSLSAADIVTALYYYAMNVDPANPHWEDRDRFILSKGHACPVWYAVLAEKGFFSKEHLNTLRKMDSILQGHADMKKTPGVDMTVGSLGQGICAGLGMALSAKLLKKTYHTWVLIGDGETQEGSIWEAAMSGAKWKLDNLTVIIDLNGIQNDSFVDEIMPVGDMKAKWEAFGWKTIEINGHQMEEIVEAVDQVKMNKGQPIVIIANTVKGKGVSFMENVPIWHGKAPNEKEFQQAMNEIRSSQ
ncbi:MAG: transketolase [Spirochaetes bacterium]|nr:transketolase [Spirochaetota bacterium]